MGKKENVMPTAVTLFAAPCKNQIGINIQVYVVVTQLILMH